MKIARIHADQRDELALAVGERLLPIARLRTLTDFPSQLLPTFVTMEDVLHSPSLLTQLQNVDQWIQTHTSSIPDSWWQSTETTLPVVAQPEKILCVGLNYRRHVEETHLEIPPYPVLFSKFANSLEGNGQVVFLGDMASQWDYEAELVIVIGRPCFKVSEEQALDYVLGYCNGNDLSARDLQFRTGQWLLGKTLAGMAPIGPYIVTRDEIPNPNQLTVRCWVNGELRQEDETGQMIFSPQYLIHYISQFMKLVPGDLIFTGTPSGVILGQPPEQRQWLKDGDRVTVEIDGLGRLETTLKAGYPVE
ncbi:fumarylacetoacetate hydrolase family protein [Sulfobacillus thermosulfidooxidans]|uniref:fumarylacetoacetate hydrolase family protein n=1 Tax=Sulfobacillus thermosulfidooxidans TaxID=28034 RepID=UPI0006B64D49|nr:fumarylacetoacetate hydrolase family protein [Sulfobacillus thermosulfidooxidans]